MIDFLSVYLQHVAFACEYRIVHESVGHIHCTWKSRLLDERKSFHQPNYPRAVPNIVFSGYRYDEEVEIKRLISLTLIAIPSITIRIIWFKCPEGVAFISIWFCPMITAHSCCILQEIR